MNVDRAGWHADAEALRTLLDGNIDPVVAASLESHLMRCDACRGVLNKLAFTEAVEQAWTGIQDIVQAPSPGLVERLLRRCGLSEESGRLLAAVPAMRGGWLLGVTSVLVFAGFAAAFSSDMGTTLFLLVAPLAPLAGVAAAFGGDADPSHEIVVTTPHSSGRLLLLRTSAVLATCAPAAVLVGLALPGPTWLTVAWLTPAAAVITLTLVLAPIAGLTNSASAVAVVWSLSVLVTSRALDPLAVVGTVSQFVCLTLVALSVAAIVARYQIIDLPRRPS